MIIVLELIIFISMVISIIYNPALLLQILDKKIENIKKENRGNVVQISVPFRDTQYGDLYGAWSLITTLTTLTHQKQKKKKKQYQLNWE